MVDGLKVFFWTTKDQLKQHLLPKLVLRANEETGEVICHETTFRGIHVHIYERSSVGIKLHGSLHKFYSGGKNDSLFSYEDVCKAITNFTETFGININWPCLQTLEIGVNIPVDNPKEIIEAAILYHGCIASSYDRNDDWVFKEWRFEDYSVKLYTKGATILRYEFHYHRLRKLKGVQISSLADLIDRRKFIACLYNLYYFTQEFLFVPVQSDTLPTELELKWSNWRNDNYWKTLDRSRKSREKSKVLEAIASNKMDDWRLFLANAVLEQGAQMLNVNVKDIDATFSNFRLSVETVADPPGDCDRHTDDGSFKAILINDYPVVRNIGYSVDVTIQAPSYILLLPRGPPSLVSFILTLMYLYNVALLMPVVSRMSLIGIVLVS